MKGKFKKLKEVFKNKILLFTALLVGIFANVSNVYAVDKIEGGNVTMESLGTIIKGLATKFQIFGIIVAFIMLVVFTIKFIVGDDEGKQRNKKLILYTLGGVVFLILIPSVINFLIGLF